MPTKVPSYIANLVKPTQKAPPARRVWSIDLEGTWVPFFTATNVTKATEVPPEDLGVPLRLAKSKDGQVRFGQNGRPTLRVAPCLNDAITSVRENFIAGLLAFTGQVMKENVEGYKAEVKKYQAAGRPVIAAMQRDVDEAVAAYEAAQAAQGRARGAGHRHPPSLRTSPRTRRSVATPIVA